MYTHATSCVKHGGGSVIEWSCIAANGKNSLLFSDNVTVDIITRMNSVVYRPILSVHIQTNPTKLIERWMMLQMDNDPKHTEKAKIKTF